MRLSFKSVQCHSQTIGHRKGCDETTCNITHSLLVIVMRLPFRCNVTHKLLIMGEYVIRLLSLQCNSQTVGHRDRADETAFHKMCNGTHSLSVIEKCDETAFHNICNATHKLLVIGRDCLS